MAYEIVHVRPDKTEIIIDIVESPDQVKLRLDSPRWMGTWITGSKLLLRFNRGRIEVREREQTPRIAVGTLVHIGEEYVYELKIRHADELKLIWINDRQFVGFDEKDEVLWATSSLTELGELLGKELAYKCSLYYEKLLAEHNIKGAL